MPSSRSKLKYAAFLRGINVGGRKKVPMAELKKLYESLGFENIKTILNSGNVVFEAPNKSEKTLVREIESAFQERFGFESKTMIRTMSAIQELVDMVPFKNVKIDKDIRLYVTFLREEPKSRLKLPCSPAKDSLLILKITDREVCSMLTIETSRSVDAMAFLEKEFGKNITTRNWNTIKKITEL